MSHPKSLAEQMTEHRGPLAPEVRQAIEQELESICGDAQFQASSRNQAFLRYVVRETLAGRAGEIKERTLGTELFGRPASYDTGSDAVVRVRANDVRKRLTTYYEARGAISGWRIQLPLRSYVPRFVPEPPSSASSVSVKPDTSEQVTTPVAPRRILTLSQMMLPTLVAIFLCAATFRWQIFAGTPYLNFWETLVAGDPAIVLVLDADAGDPHAISTDDLRAVNPLLQAAAGLHVPVLIRSSEDRKQDQAADVPVYVTHHFAPGTALQAGAQQGASITVLPGNHPALRIGGTSAAAIELAVRALSSPEAFPQALEMALRRSKATRLDIADGKEILANHALDEREPWLR